MKIQNSPQQNLYNQQNLRQNRNVNFTGAATTLALRFLDTNQAWGANAVDLGSMVIPRTVVDFANRGPDAGVETARREASGTVNHSLIGVYGIVAALATSVGLNKAFDIRADKIFADNETFDIVGNAYHKYLHDGKTEDPLEATIREVFSTIKTSVDGKEKTLSPREVDVIVEKYKEILKTGDIKTLKLPNETKDFLVRYITEATGSEVDFSLKAYNKATTNSASNLVENMFNLSKILKDENKKVVKSFKDAAKFEDVKVIKDLKSFNKGRTLLGMAIASGVGMSIQPLNIYLTKKKTGSDGFVGVEGREKDKSGGFKMMKATAAAIFGGGIIADLATKEGGLLKNIQFKGLIPTISQYKLIYGVTIMSRFLAARDKDELRESVVKDTLGFLNWLVLGNFVAKGVALAMNKDKSLLKNPNEASFFKKKLKTRDEVLIEGLKRQNLSTVKEGKALKFSEMMKLLPNSDISKAVKGKLRILNIAQVAGYLYSGLVLGVGIPKLNIYMTNKSEEKRKAKLAAQKAVAANSVQTNSADKTSNIQADMNTKFLAQHQSLKLS